jgi:hypothetical protein
LNRSSSGRNGFFAFNFFQNVRRYDEVMGKTFIRDGVDVHGIMNSTYDFVMSSHKCSKNPTKEQGAPNLPSYSW